MSAPHPLPENAGLAFHGEPLPASARLTTTAAEKLLAARNTNGRPNADVVRRFADGSRDGIREHWAVDFPPDMDAQEAALYAGPARLRRAAVQYRDLRNALARRERYLATAAAGTKPAWAWLDATVLPDDTLLVVARDDDFTHGVLSARPFSLWWRQHHLPRSPLLAVTSYPFPWPPGKGLSALTAAQEEQRYAIARAARSGQTESLEGAVAAAYGWPADLADKELLDLLMTQNKMRR